MSINKKPKKKTMKKLQKMFNNLVEKDTDEQAEFFLKSFIFDLGKGWKEVGEIATKFKKHVRKLHEKHDVNPVQAGEFLQQHGKTRTAIQRKHECKDIDLNNDGRITFTEYALIHWKVMILKAYYKRFEKEPEEDLSKDGVGLVGVGHKLLDELFTPPAGIDEALLEAIENFTKKKKAREAKIAKLESRAEKGGVKGMAAKNQLKQMENEDQTPVNQLELTLAAAQRAQKKKRSGSMELHERESKVLAEESKKKAAGKKKLANLAARFGSVMKSTLKSTKTKQGSSAARAKTHMAIRGTPKKLKGVKTNLSLSSDRAKTALAIRGKPKKLKEVKTNVSLSSARAKTHVAIRGLSRGNSKKKLNKVGKLKIARDGVAPWAKKAIVESPKNQAKKVPEKKSE